MKIATLILFPIWILLLVVWILKFIAIWNAIKWLRNCGKSYKDELKANPPKAQSGLHPINETGS
jgi:hypothetical protein